MVDGRFSRGLPAVRRESRNPYAWGEEVGGRLVGLIGLVPTGNRTVRVRWLRVDPEWRHTAIAAKLIDGLRNHCCGQGYLKVVADAKIAPSWLWRQFERRGFRLCRQEESGGRELHFVISLEALS
jgi:N-acetylglutamate synthase-like GNAT family acetyltransferase